MPVFYYENPELKTQLSQPTLTRARHRYRGPRESYKLNLEISQLLYDFTRLYDRVIDAEQLHLDGVVTVTEPTDPPITELAADWIGLYELTSRVQRLRDRVRTLEALNA